MPTEETETHTSESNLEKPGTAEKFDVFLAHNSVDKPLIKQLYKELKRRGFHPWMDDEQIPPGHWLQEDIQEALCQSKTVAVIIGQYGLGRWESLELRSSLQNCVERNKPIVIPVLLPGVSEFPPNVPFLKALKGVQFQKEITEDENALENLIWGITGKKEDLIEPIPSESVPSGPIPSESQTKNTVRKSLVSLLLIVIILFLAHKQAFDLLSIDAKLAGLVMRVGYTFRNTPFSEHIAIVTIEDDNFDKSWRAKHAALIRKLSEAEAKVIAFDMYFEEPGDFDQTFTQAIQAAKDKNTSVIVGAQTFENNEPKIIADLRLAVSGIGNLCVGEVLPDEVRKIPLTILKKHTEPLSSLSLKVVEAYLEKRVFHIDSKHQQIFLGKEHEIYCSTVAFSDLQEMKRAQNSCHVIEDGDQVINMFIALSSPAVLSERTYSYENILSQSSSEWLKLSFQQKIVLVGVQKKFDRFNTYMEEERYGVELHADAINTLLQYVAIRFSLWWDMILILVFGGIGGLVGHRFSHDQSVDKIFQFILLLVIFISTGFFMAILFLAKFHIILNMAYYWGAYISLSLAGSIGKDRRITRKENS